MGIRVRPWTKFDYDLERWPFPEFVAKSLDVKDLTALRADLPLRTWHTDQQSPWHAPFYEAFGIWRRIFARFVKEVIAPRLGVPCYWQAVPTFRVQLPGNLAVGAFHRDADYNHPLGEVSFWVPMTPAAGTSTVWIADDEGGRWPADARPGEVIQFDAAGRLHGNVINETGRARVSFDFRLIPVDALPAVEGEPTKHSGLRFVPGGYYSRTVVG